MTASEIAETLINGIISDARNAILYEHGGGIADAVIGALEVVYELSYGSGEMTAEQAILRIQRLLLTT